MASFALPPKNFWISFLSLIIVMAVAVLINTIHHRQIQTEEVPLMDQSSVASPAPRVQLTTTQGTITLELYPDQAPETVANFLDYVDSGFYDGTIFHRVIPEFMIQGGGFTPDFTQKETGAPIKNEAGNGLTNLKGTLAMARTQLVDSATAQFFINTVDNPHLNHKAATPEGFGYCVFGKVIAGMDVVEKIEHLPTSRRGYFNDVPTEEVQILSARRELADSYPSNR